MIGLKEALPNDFDSLFKITQSKPFQDYIKASMRKTDSIVIDEEKFNEMINCESDTQGLIYRELDGNKLENTNTLVSKINSLYIPCVSINNFVLTVITKLGKSVIYFKETTEEGETSRFWTVFGVSENLNTLISFGSIERDPRGNCCKFRIHTPETKEVFGTICLAFAAIQNRLSYTDDFDVEEKKVTTSAKKKKKGKKAYTQHKVRLYKCYTLTRVAPVENLHKKKVVITCPAWGVRGHYRHYKNGKVVFISPYTKGKDRNNYQPKEYGLFRPTKGGKENEINRTALSV